MGWSSQNTKKANVLLIIVLAVVFWMLLLLVELILGYSSYKLRISAMVNSQERSIRLREIPPNLHLVEEISEEAKDRNNIINLSQDSYILKTDKDGFILPSEMHIEPDVTLFFLGGSTTECRAVDPLQRFPYLAGRILEKRSGMKVNSYNGGVSGNHSFHSINTLINKVLPYSPDIVILKHNSNDILLIPYGSYWDKAPGKTLVVQSQISSEKSQNSIFTFPVIRTFARRALNKMSSSPVPDNFQKYSKKEGEMVNVDRDLVLTQFRNSLYTFIAICRSWNIEPVLMTQAIIDDDQRMVSDPIPESFSFPMPKDPLKDSIMLNVLYSFHHLFNETIREVCEVKHVVLIDLKKEVPSRNHTYIYDLYHYNNQGSEYVANIIATALEPLLSMENSDTLSIAEKTDLL